MISVDLIKSKLDQLTQKSQNATVKYWKPENDAVIRIIPSKKPDSLPFVEFKAYYLNGRYYTAPSSFGMPDPIQDVLQMLRKKQDDYSKNLYKMLMPSLKAVVPILVRGKDGIHLWSMSKTVYVQVLSLLTEIPIDPVQGRDFTVKSDKKGYIIIPKINPSILCEDYQTLIDSQPDYLEIVKRNVASYDELSGILKQILGDEEQTASQTQTVSPF